MSGLGHYIERQGVPTAGISLVREHTEAARPPRALWVPFDFGHPFGAPGAPALQRSVLLELLALFERDRGPVLADFEGATDAAVLPGAATGGAWACPVPLADNPVPVDAGPELGLERAARDELRALLPWYEQAIAASGRTTVGASRVDPGELPRFIAGFLSTPYPDPANESLSPPLALKAAVEDLKQIYFAAASVQPGARRPLPAQFHDWFWTATRAAELVHAVRNAAATSEDPTMSMIANYLLVPSGHADDGA